MVKVLITGGSGLLGKSLKETKPVWAEIKSTWYTNFIACDYQMDVGNKSQVNYIFNMVKPDVVIHCAAIGSVDYAEQFFMGAREVNVLGVQNVARAAHNHKARFVFISSNAVFDGDNPPYAEGSERSPVNRYGKFKVEAEDRVMELNNWLIFRPFMLYGHRYKNARPNWYNIIHDALTGHKELRLVNDVWWQMTEANSCAMAIWTLVEKSPQNQIYNIAADERITLYEFGMMMARVLAYENKHQLKAIASAELTGLARRPVDTTYDLSKIHGLGIKLPSVEAGLKSLL